MSEHAREPPSAAMSAERTEAFMAARPLLLSVAYRMTGSRADADDLVQEAWLRWHQAAGPAVADPAAYLVTIVTRLAMDHYRSARARRERYVGPWLPEPVVDAESWLGPLETVEQRELLALATLALYERLTPLQRAVVVLREAFSYPYDDVARVVGSSAAGCRQAHRRAKARLRADGRQRTRTAVGHERLLAHLLAALATGELAQLEQALAAEVVLVADGGGEVAAALRPIVGAGRVARFLLAISSQAPPGTQVQIARVNGSPGLIVEVDGAVSHVLAVAGDERIEHIAIVRAPVKLALVRFAHHNPRARFVPRA